MPKRIIRIEGTFSAALLIAIAIIAILTGCAGKAKTEAKAEPKAPAAGAVASAKTSKGPLDKMIREAAAQPAAEVEGSGWKALFDGRTMGGWAVTDFGGQGHVGVESGLMVLYLGEPLTGVNWTNDAPKVDYEIELEAMKLQGSDFFCGLTFPVKDSFCTLILGGWGGSVVGLSSIDGSDASENETTKFINFDTGRWYRVRVRVTAKRIEAWLDDKQIVDLITTGRTIALRFGEIESSKPLGIATYATTAALRGIKIRRL